MSRPAPSPGPSMSARRPEPVARARGLESIHDIDAALWDRCAGGDNPLVGHDFLACLEDSRSAVPETGWAPGHIVLEDPQGEVVACAPAYFKSHSHGEYVFDHGWADAFERAGGAYYPKLLVAVPFTPATGPRLLVAPGGDTGERRRLLASAIVRMARQAGVSGAHVNFATEPEWRLMGELGFLQRTGVQFHWRNRGYEDFDAFLETLSSRRRKTIRRERRDAVAAGIDIEVLSGDRLTPSVWDAFFAFYRDTGERKWGVPYLTRRFFDLLGERMADKVALVMCRRGERWVAGALNLIGATALFGRYWGCAEDHRFLHFECCYYQAIDYAIRRGLARVEAGAQGPHKIRRGYVPVPTYSSHWIEHGGLRDAVARFLEQETDHIEGEIDAIRRHHSPFRHGDGEGRAVSRT